MTRHAESVCKLLFSTLLTMSATLLGAASGAAADRAPNPAIPRVSHATATPWRSLDEWTPTLRGEVKKFQGRVVALKDVSLLHWTDTADTMVVTFGEVADGARTGQTKRQYWIRAGNGWKIFFEGVIG